MERLNITEVIKSVARFIGFTAFNGTRLHHDPLSPLEPTTNRGWPKAIPWPTESDGMEPVNQMVDTGWDSEGRYLVDER